MALSSGFAGWGYRFGWTRGHRGGYIVVGGDRRGDQRLQGADHNGVRSLDRFPERG